MRLFADHHDKNPANLVWVVVLTVLLLIITVFTSSVSASSHSSELAAHLKAYDFGAKATNTWKAPSEPMKVAFANALTALIDQNVSLANELMNEFGYRALSLTDSTYDKTFYLLEEIAKSGDIEFIGGGTVVFYPQGKAIALEAPHPKFDTFTGTQAIDTFLATNSQFLLLPGTRRDANPAPSQCSGDYSESDVAHQNMSLFSIAHDIVSQRSDDIVFIQFHGFGATTLAKLQQQCDSNNDALVNLSEGVDYYTNPNEFSFLHLLRTEIESQTAIKACVFGNDTTSLGGTFNVQGRSTNLSDDSCHTNAQASSKRFIHLEQSYLVRKSLRTDMAQAINTAIIRYTSN